MVYYVLLENILGSAYDAYSEANLVRQMDKHECLELQGTWFIYVYKGINEKYNNSKYFCNSKSQSIKLVRKVISIVEL